MSKIQTNFGKIIVLNHPFFIICYRQHILTTQIKAVHLKSDKNVEHIQKMFIDGNLGYLPNHCNLTIQSWRIIVDQFIGILHFQIVEDCKMLPQYLGDLNSANPEISVNLNTDVHDRFLRCCVIFPIARYVGTLTLPILIADFF